MREFVIYYSRSNEVDDSVMDPLLQTFCENLPHRNVKLTKHARGENYNPELVVNADLVIVGVRDMGDSIPEIGKGCHDEIKAAHDNDIPVISFIDVGIGEVWAHCITEEELDEDPSAAWQIGYATLDLWGNLNDAKDNGTLCAYIDQKTQGVIPMIFDLLGPSKYSEIFEGNYETGFANGMKADLNSLESLKDQMTRDDIDDEMLLLG